VSRAADAGRDSPNLPYPAIIESYGNGGFRFADMSHRGSLICLPSGIWAWAVTSPGEIDEAALAPLFAEKDMGFVIIGTGRDPWDMPEALRWRFRERKLNVEVMTTRPAVRTYNIVLGEGRRVAAALIAVD
jgi:uncharacterized protein